MELLALAAYLAVAHGVQRALWQLDPEAGWWRTSGTAVLWPALLGAILVHWLGVLLPPDDEDDGLPPGAAAV